MDEIVRSVNALFALADQIEQQVADATKRTEALTQAVLAKAFRGELVATIMSTVTLSLPLDLTLIHERLLKTEITGKLLWLKMRLTHQNRAN